MLDNLKQSSKPKKKYLAYVRVSSKGQEDNWSPEIQTDQIKKYAELNHLEISDFVEGVESSFRPGRKKLALILTRLKKEKLGGIIMASVDRSSRNFQDIGTFYKLIEQGYHFHFAAERLNTESDEDKVRIYDLWGQATVYSQRLRVKVRSAFDKMLQKGLFPTRAPIGYLNRSENNTPIVVPDPIQSKCVKQAFELYSTGLYDILKLQTELEKIGLRNPDGKVVGFKTLYKLLRNKFYFGIIEWSEGRIYQGIHQPIISKLLYDKVQAVLDKKSFKHHRRFFYIYQGLIPCPICGRTLRCISSVKPYRNYKYYNCRSTEHKYNLMEDYVEEQFLTNLKKIQFSQEDVNDYLTAAGQLREDLKNRQTEITANIKFEVNKIEERISGLMDDYTEQRITTDDFNSLKLRLLEKKAKFVDQLNSTDIENNEALVKLENLGKLIKDLCLAYKTASEEFRRRLVKSLVENFTWKEKLVIPNWKSECVPFANRDKMLSGSATENRTPIHSLKSCCPNH